MVVVDTNVLAYLLITGDRTRDAQALFRRDADWRSEAFILVEFSNILATYLRARSLTIKQARVVLAEADRQLKGLVNVPHDRALEVAERLSVSAYDARFLAAASSLGGKLVTEDVRLRAAAPTRTVSLADALAG
jgi:predicted nucleic acid-binding protein